MDPVVHFEMPYENRQRMSKFYSGVFGWKAQEMGPEMGHYVVVETQPMKDGRPTVPGVINGGFYEKTDDKPAQYPSVVIAVQDIHKAMAKVTAAGGKVLGEPVEIPNVGPYVSFVDTEGNRVSMLQPKM